jgi:hypothetical protein
MAPRYLFLSSDRRSASGGVAVTYQIAATLRRFGHDAFMLHQGAVASHYAEKLAVPVLHTSAVRQVQARHRGGVRGLVWHSRKAIDYIGRDRGGGSRLALRPDDVIVTPEYLYDAAMEAFPGQRLVVLSQNSFSYLRACARALRRGRDPAGAASYNIAIADICEEAFALVGAAPVARIPVSPNPTRFPFREEKEPLIAFMPRKRAEEALIVARALERRGRLGGHALLRIDGMPHDEVRAALGRSRFFLSLMRTEALGFPAAEAMASGCVVVGYTGIGTREYFHEGTGIPVTEDDTMALVQAVEGAVAEYRHDPARLDALRREGCRVVHERYGTEVFERALEREWARIDRALATGVVAPA